MRLPAHREYSRLFASVLADGRAGPRSPEVLPEALASWAESEPHRRALQSLAPRSDHRGPPASARKALGLVALISTTREYGPADLRMAEELAQRAALSIESARLYREAKRAVQVRDDVLGVVAHDLRNPLGTVLMQAVLLRRQESAEFPRSETRRGDRASCEPDEPT